jgi:hypothetical protein
MSDYTLASTGNGFNAAHVQSHTCGLYCNVSICAASMEQQTLAVGICIILYRKCANEAPSLISGAHKRQVQSSRSCILSCTVAPQGEGNANTNKQDIRQQKCEYSRHRPYAEGG